MLGSVSGFPGTRKDPRMKTMGSPSLRICCVSPAQLPRYCILPSSPTRSYSEGSGCSELYINTHLKKGVGVWRERGIRVKSWKGWTFEGPHLNAPTTVLRNTVRLSQKVTQAQTAVLFCFCKKKLLINVHLLKRRQYFLRWLLKKFLS